MFDYFSSKIRLTEGFVAPNKMNISILRLNQHTKVAAVDPSFFLNTQEPVILDSYIEYRSYLEKPLPCLNEHPDI